MTERDRADQPVISLAFLPPTSQQRRLALIVAVLIFASFGVAAPFADMPLAQLPAVIPTLAGMITVNDLITSALLFSQYAIVPSRAILVLAGGYLFTALIVIPQALTFPGVFSPTGLLGANLQSAGHLYLFWHLGSALAVLGYALLKNAAPANQATSGSIRSEIRWCVVIVFGVVVGLSWYATSGYFMLPFFTDTSNFVKVTWANIVNVVLVIFDLAVLAVLWVRRRSVLDYWLMLVMCAMITEQTLLVLLSSARFSLGWYSGRLFSLTTSIFVLVLLLAETTRLYGRLARTNMILERERENKLMSIDAITLSIAHELKQPLGAISANAYAVARFLRSEDPNLDKARATAINIADATNRTSEVLDDIRRLFHKTDQRPERININDIVVETLQALRSELTDRGIADRSELTSDLPFVMGHKGQLREVIFNLLYNALEAMNDTSNRNRILQVITQRHNTDAIVVGVKDTGHGIDPKQLEHIFDAFVTTKPGGTGLGLALCRMIIERHGGQLSAFSDGKNGAVFQFVLPVESMREATIGAK